ncbi:MAG TPA: hypothetical protein VEJ20_01005 [Candidatus Eremiobacteraceae bacterium]|nr:hypothetical protein [Candidatus Eremiobacteraceae bacterium]
MMRYRSSNAVARDGVAVEQVEEEQCERDQDDVEHAGLLELLRAQHGIEEIDQDYDGQDETEDLIEHCRSLEDALPILPRTKR